MKLQHIIEYIMLALIVLIPVFAIVNPASQFRLERIEMYLGYPDVIQDFAPVDKMMIGRVRELLLENGAEHYYDQNGLRCRTLFLEREKELIVLLEQLTCKPQGTYGINYIPEVRDCDERARKDAEALLKNLIENDMDLFGYTSRKARCNILKEGNFLEYGEKVMQCKCGYLS